MFYAMKMALSEPLLFEIKKVFSVTPKLTIERGMNMKRLNLTMLLSLILFFLIGTSTMAAEDDYWKDNVQIILQIDNPYMYENGFAQELDPGIGTKPLIRDGKTLLPIASIIKAFGGEVKWEGKEQKVTLVLGDKKVEMWIGKKNALVNGVSNTLDVAPQIINSKTMVPLRFASDKLGVKLIWHGASQVISLYYHKDNMNSFWFEGEYYEQIKKSLGRYYDGGTMYSVDYPTAWGIPYVVNGYFSSNLEQNLYDYRTVFYSKDGTTITGHTEDLEADETAEGYMQRTGRVESDGFHGDLYRYIKVDEGVIPNADRAYSVVMTEADTNSPDTILVINEYLFFKGPNVVILKLTSSVDSNQSQNFDISMIPQFEMFVETTVNSFQFQDGAGAAG